MKKVFLSFAFIFACYMLTAQDLTSEGNYNVKLLNFDNGFSHLSIYFKYEDSQGFMWLATTNAINRFDGKTTKVYNLNKYFKNCPILTQGLGFVEDDKTNLYIGNIRGLYMFNRKENNFTLLQINKSNSTIMPFAYKNGLIWCFNTQYDIITLDVKTGEFKVITKAVLPALKSAHIYSNTTYSFYDRWPILDQNNTIWAVGENQINTFNTKTKLLTKRPIPSNQTSFYVSKYNKNLHELIIGTNNGLLLIHTDQNTQKQIISFQNKNIGLIRTLATNKNRLVINSPNIGLISINYPNLNSFELYSIKDKNEFRGYGLFYFDKKDRIWSSINGVAIKVLDFNKTSIQKFPNIPYNNNFMNFENSIGNILELPNKSIVFHPYWIKNDSASEIKKYKGFIAYSDIYSDNLLGGIWFKKQDKKGRTVFEFQGQNKKNITITSQIALGTVQDFVRIENNRILIASDNGLFWLRDQSNTIEKINDIPNAFKINILNKTTLAVSYLHADMLMYNLSENSLKNVQKILPGIQSFYIQASTDLSSYWVGSDQGVFLLDKTFSNPKIFDANNGLAGSFIYGILQDKEGNLWCSHQKGLSSVMLPDYKIINYDLDDNIQDWDFNNKSFYKSKDGTLYFGGVRGVNYFKPPLNHTPFYTPTLYLDEVEVNAKDYQLDINPDSLNNININFEDNLKIKPLIRDLEIDKKASIIFRIYTDTPSEWQFLDKNTPLNFTSLNPGTYTLEMGIYDKFIQAKKVSKTLKITVSAPFYKNSFFWLVVGLVIASSLMYVFNKWNQKQNQKQFEQKLALERMRSKITADLHDDLGSSLSSLQVNSLVANKLLNNNTPKAKELLQKIENQARHISETLADIIWSMKPGTEEVIDFNSKIKNFASDILGSLEIDYRIQIDKTINAYLQDINLRKNLIFICKEAINNAAKYSKASHIDVICKVSKKNLTIQIIDNGQGFEVNENIGNGIRNMRTRAEALNGSFTIASTPSKGCSIEIQLPVSL